MNEQLMITDAIAMTAGERAALSDETIEQLAYGIRYADCFDVAKTTGIDRDVVIETLHEMRARLDAIEAAQRAAKAAQAKRVPVEMFTCMRCGEKFPHRMAMSSAEGTVCPDCYDDASN